MAKIKMSDAEKHDMYVFNCNRREQLLNEAMKQNTPEDRIKFVVDYFLNKLDPSIIAQIDGCVKENIVPFKYDYSFLEDYGSFDIRRKEDRRWGLNSYGFSMSSVDNDIRGSEKLRVFPAVYALKMGTCIMFASEIQRFAHDFGIDSQVVQKMALSYDKFDGYSTEGKEIHTDRLIPMQHFYNIITIDGEKYKIDIAGYLTAEDLKRNHPELAVEEREFYFSKKLTSNPFSRLANTSSRDVVDLTAQNQPQ